MTNLNVIIRKLLAFAVILLLPICLAAQPTCLGSLDMVPVLGSASGAPINAQPLAVVPVSCATGSFGTVDANVSGGTNPIAYNWNTGSSQSSLSSLNIGTYTVSVTDATNCTGSASITLNHVGTMVVGITGNTLNCTNSPIALATQTGFDTYSWTTGSNTNTATATTTGTYTVQATYANGCSGSSSIAVVIATAPVGAISGATPITCLAATSTLTAPAGNAYAWAGTGFTTATNLQSVTVNAAGTYQVTTTGTGGCTAVANVTVVVNKNRPTVNILPTNPTLTCNTSSVTLSASTTPTSGLAYSWNNGGGATPSRVASLGGTYTVTVTNTANGCTRTAYRTVVVTRVLPTVTLTIVRPTGARANAAVTAIVSPATCTIEWRTGTPNGTIISTAARLSNRPAGTYYLKVINPVTGCITARTVTL